MLARKLGFVLMELSVIEGVSLGTEEPTETLRLVNVFVPSLQEEVGVAAEVGVFPRDASVDLENTVLV